MQNCLLEPQSRAPTGEVRRTAFYLPSQGRALFAWLHVPAGTPCTSHGVVLCPPIGHEQNHSHRSWRHLADAIARAGMLALRIDYHGTGDSPGGDDDPELVRTWLSNIADAQTRLRHELSCAHITLVGLRIGALLALHAATVASVDNLVLWAPVKGRAYVREMKALSLTTGMGTSEDVEAAGYVLSQATAAALGRLELPADGPHCAQILIVDRDDLRADAKLTAHFAAFGVPVTQMAQAGYADMMAEPHFTKVPHQAIAAVVDWLREVTPVDAPKTEVPLPRGFQAEVAMDWSGQPIRERALSLHSDPDLLGVVTEPGDGAAAGLPTIILVNAGAAYHVGPSRLYVLLARRLAVAGFRCVRLDLCGLGDSASGDPQAENDPYASTMFRDIDLALCRLRELCGAERFVLMGLCSGGYAAFQSGVQLRDPGLVESVLINPIAYYWKEGMTLEGAPVNDLARFRHCWNAALRPDKWLRFLLGKGNFGLRAAVRVLRDYLRIRFARAVASASAPEEPAALGHPPREDLSGDLARLAQAGRHLTCFFSEHDPSYDILLFYARRRVRKLRRTGRLQIYNIPNADHTFTARGARGRVIELIAGHLEGRYAPTCGR